jgi:hypothetical protein
MIIMIIIMIGKNCTLEALYLMGTNMDEKNRAKIEDAWKKHLVGHQTTTYGFSFVRANPENVYLPPTPLTNA